MIQWNTGVRDGVCSCQETVRCFTAIMPLKTPLSTVSLQAPWHDVLPTFRLFFVRIPAHTLLFITLCSPYEPWSPTVSSSESRRDAWRGSRFTTQHRTRSSVSFPKLDGSFNPSYAVLIHPDWLDWTSPMHVLAKVVYLSAVNRKCDTWRQIL